jgi:hypothetical protein
MGDEGRDGRTTTASLVLGAWRDGIGTVLAQPVVLIAALPIPLIELIRTTPTSTVGEIQEIALAQFLTAATVWFVLGCRSVSSAPPLGEVVVVGMRRLVALLPFALAHEWMVNTWAAMVIVGPYALMLPMGALAFYLAVRLLLFPQVAVAEGRGLWRAVRRAWSIGRGRFWWLALGVWLPWLVIPTLVLRRAHDVHPGFVKIAGCGLRSFELAVLTVLYMRLASLSRLDPAASHLPRA